MPDRDSPQQSVEFPSDVAGEPAEVWIVGSDGTPPRLMARLHSGPARGLREMVDALEDGVLLIDDRLRLVDANAVACRITGYPLEQLLRLGLQDIVTPESVQEMMQLWQRFQNRGSQNGRYVVMAADGTLRSVSYRAWTHALPGYHLCLLQETVQ